MDLVTIVVPSLNEPDLATTVTQLRIACGGLPVIVVAEHDWGTGIGATARRGVERARTPWVLFAMADGSEAPVAVRAMVEAIATEVDGVPVDAVFGNRWGPESSVTGYPPLKRIGNRLGNCGIALAAGQTWYSDWTDLAKAYRREHLLQLSWADDFACTVQIPLRYVARWPHVAVVPMQWRERVRGESSYTVGQAAKVLWAAVKEVV